MNRGTKKGEEEKNEKDLEEIKNKIEHDIREATKEERGRNLIGSVDGYTEQEKLEIMNAKQVIKDVIRPSTLSRSSSERRREEQKGGDGKLPPVKSRKIVNIQMKEEKLNILNMFHADFKVVRV